MHPNCRRGSLPNIRGSRLSAVPFCISILTSVRRIIKIAVRFLHTKTALCDRKDTQSRFAVNAARSIVCVETDDQFDPMDNVLVFQCRTQHCVCRDTCLRRTTGSRLGFQCRTQHCVCRDKKPYDWKKDFSFVSMPHAALCVSRQGLYETYMALCMGFQCRTQHCVCRDTVSRSPCPARAEKAFWKDTLFCAVFGVCG